MKNWFVANTRTRSEALAQANLVNQGFETYLPQYNHQRRHARRVDYVRAPLFPRYLFVRMDLEKDHWRPVLSTIGVQSLVSNGLEPAAVPDGIIEEIRSREAENGLVSLTDLRQFRNGEAITLDRGPFAGREGLFDSKSDDQRVIVLLNIMGRPVRVRIPMEDIQAHA